MSLDPKVLVVLVGGLGTNQLLIARNGTRSLYDSLQAIEHTHVTSLHDVGYWFGNCPDLIGHIRETREAFPWIERVIAVEHSMGWEPAVRAATRGLVDFLIAADPVGIPFKDRDVWPKFNHARVSGIFAKGAPTLGIKQLYVADGPDITEYYGRAAKPDRDHNELVHDADFIASVLDGCIAVMAEIRTEPVSRQTPKSTPIPESESNIRKG